MFVTPTPDELQDQPQDMHTAAEVAQLHHHEHGNATTAVPPSAPRIDNIKRADPQPINGLQLRHGENTET